MMINNTLAESSNIDANKINFKKCIQVGNYLIIIAFMTMISCILVTFVFESNFSLMIQIVAHISTIITAAIVKVGYVIRCIGAHGLGHKAY